MNKIINTISAALLAVVAAMPLASCGDIDEAERVIAGTPNEYDRTFETSQIEVGGENFEINDQHTMLLMDFTGWMCVNCPNVAEFLSSKVMPVYPSVLVSLHMTSNSFSAGHLDGYNCPAADGIADWINGSAIASALPLPSVSVDNVEYGGKTLNSNTTDIENLVSKRFKECNVEKTARQAVISVNIHPTGDGRYDISTLVIDPKAKDCTVRLWLIEEGLISQIQASLNGHIFGYENHGILRQVIGGDIKGQNLTLDANGQGVLRATLDLSGTGYVPENCRVVAFITDVNGREVINCTEASLQQ